MGSNINIKTIKITPRKVVLGLLAVLALVLGGFVFCGDAASESVASGLSRGSGPDL